MRTFRAAKTAALWTLSLLAAVFIGAVALMCLANPAMFLTGCIVGSSLYALGVGATDWISQRR